MWQLCCYSTHHNTLVVAMENSIRCMACGNAVEEIHYQSRAADEAHTTIKSCPRCPLEANRLRVTSPKNIVPLGSFTRHVRNKSSVHATPIVTRTGLIRYLEVSLPDKTASSFLNGELKDVLIHDISIKLNDNQYETIATINITGPFVDETIIGTSTIPYSPKVRLNEYTTVNIGRRQPSSRLTRRGVFSIVSIPYVRHTGIVWSRVVDGEDQCTMLIRIDSLSSTDVDRLLTAVLMFVGEWPCIWNFMDKARVAMLANRAARAWDATVAPRNDYVYTPKADGERAYLVIYQKIAYLFSKAGSYPLAGWRVLNKFVSRVLPVIIDVEFLPNYGMILIDMITTVDGQFAEQSRSISWVLREHKKIAQDVLPVRILVREYNTELRHVLNSLDRLLYPTDGVIAIPSHGTASLKLKDERSMELQLTDRNSLVTADGDTVVEEWHNQSGYQVGTIVELRFLLVGKNKQITVTSTINRPDKAKPNSSSAVMSILRSFDTSMRDDESERRELLMWCNALRRYLLLNPPSHRPEKRIILDIGTGTGQSFDDMLHCNESSFVLLEPDKKSCNMILRRDRQVRLLRSIPDLLSVIKPLALGSIRYVLINARLEDLLAETDVCNNLFPELRVATCTYSAHYCIPSLYMMHFNWNVPIVGCTYLYDGVNIGGYLVDGIGVSMKRTGESTCVVKWGTDKGYAEPYTEKSHYSSFATVEAGLDYVNLAFNDMDSVVYKIASKVQVIHC